MSTPVTAESLGLSPDEASDELLVAIADVEQEFSAVFRTMRTLFKRRAEAIHPELSVFGFKLIRSIQRAGDCQQSVLADVLEADKGLVSRTVRQLEELGLVVRTADPHDGRAQRVTLTEKADRELDEVLREDRSVLRERLATWTPDEVRRLAELLRKLSDIRE